MQEPRLEVMQTLACGDDVMVDYKGKVSPAVYLGHSIAERYEIRFSNHSRRLLPRSTFTVLNGKH